MVEDKPNDDNVHLTPEELLALKEMIKDKLWWNEASKRIKRVSVIAGAVLGGLAFLALWWPWITRIVQLIIKDIPTQ